MQLKESFTIKELSELFGMSRQAMSKHVAKIDEHFLIKNPSGYRAVLWSGVKQLASNLGREELLVDSNQSDINTDTEHTYSVAPELLLQLQQKDEQIKELHRLLDQQQQLTLQANKQNEQLQSQIQLLQAPAEEPPISEETAVEPGVTKPGFFARLFGRSTQ